MTYPLDKITILLLREGTGDSRLSTEVSCKKKKIISRPTLRLPVEAEDVDGKKGEKGKNIFCYTKDLSATGPLLGNLGVFPFARGREYGDSGSILGLHCHAMKNKNANHSMQKD